MIFGIIIGLLISILIFTILSYFRKEVEAKIKIVEKIKKQKGAIYMPDDDAEEFRKEVIEKNNKLGRDTYVDELR